MGLWEDLVRAAHGGAPQVTQSGQVHYIDPQGDQGSVGSYLGHLLRATGQTFGEAITPSLTPIGRGGRGDQPNVPSGPEWIRKQTEPGLYDNPLTAGVKGFAGEAQARMTPGTGVDFGAAVLGEGSGGALAGSLATRAGQQAAQALASERAAARSSATTKLQEGARKPGEVWQGPAGGGKPPGYHTQRAEARRLNMGGEERPRMPNEGVPERNRYRGPRPSDTDVQQFETGGRPDRALPGPTPQHPVNRARANSERAMGRLDDHQLNMQRYRMAEDEVQRALGPNADPTALDRLDPQTRRLLEQHILNTRVNRPNLATPEQEINRNAARMEPLNLGELFPEQNMGSADDLTNLLQGESDAKVGQQLNQLGQMRPQEQIDLIRFFQELLANNPNMTLDEFLTIMKSASGGIF